jgi:hypothetical protein
MSDTANDNRQQTGSRLFFFLVKLSALLVFLAIFLTFLQVTLRYFFNTQPAVAPCDRPDPVLRASRGLAQ